MISGLKSFGVFLTLIAVAHGASDQSAIYQKIQNDQCIAQKDYLLSDPGNCQPACDLDEKNQFCSEPLISGSNTFTCQPFPDSCRKIAGLPEKAGSTTASQDTSATTTSGAASTTAGPSAGSSSSPSGASSATTIAAGTGATSAPVGTASPGGAAGGSPLNSQQLNPDTATKDYLDGDKCCRMAKKGHCDANPYYMRVACAATCGTTGTNVFDAGKATTNVKAECKKQ